MANNFIPWLGSDATTSPQQANYGKIAKTGFEAGGFVKAEDFNAALRMTTLVCAGIASVFGFDSNTIDVSEDIITKAIQGAKITLGEITASMVISRDISANTLSVTDIKASERISGQSLTILNVERITAGGTIIGTEYKIDNSTVIDNNKNISGASLTIGNNVATISAAGDISGTSYTAGNLKVIDKDGNISGESVTSKKITSTGPVTANSLNINGRGISSQGVITGDSLVVNSLETIDSSRNIKNVGSITASGDITTNSDLGGNNITATGDLTGNNITVSKALKGNSLEVGRIDGVYMHIGPATGTTNLSVNSSGDITTEGSISSKSDLHAKNSIIVGGSSITMGIERINNTGIMFPACLNLLHIKNCAQKNASGAAVTFESTRAADSMEFGCNLPTSISSNNRSYIFLVFMGIRVAGSGSWESFHSDYSGLLTANDNDDRQATIIFNIYSGNGISVESNWGTARISYQPYSLSASTGCYLSYEGPSGFSGTINIEVKMYPIAIFG